MAAPFTITSVSNYNSNPPSDDGSQTASNRVQWSTQKTKLADPVYNAFNSSETETSDAFGKVVGGAGITTTAISYTVTSSDQSKLVKATASGITITTPDATVVGSPFVFFVLNSSSADITFAGNGTQTIDGSTELSIPAGCGMMVNTDGSNWFSGGQNFANVQQEPQGRLTLTSGTPVLNTDTIAATSVIYTYYTGNKIPISTNGTSFKMRTFSELTLTLVSNHLASTLYDVFVFDNSGVLTIATGPAWNTNTAGSCARGTGSGTTQLARVNGLWTNAVSMTARNGSTTYTVAANEGTFVGSIFIDSGAGQVSCYLSYGQNRKWGVWNCYNRVPIILQVGDSTSSWNYGTSGVRASNNVPSTYTASSFNEGSGTACNGMTVLTGLAEEPVSVSFRQATSSNSSSAGVWKIGIGLNSISEFTGLNGAANTLANQSGMAFELEAKYDLAPSVGINIFVCLENANSGQSSTFSGTQSGMLLRASYRG